MTAQTVAVRVTVIPGQVVDVRREVPAIPRPAMSDTVRDWYWPVGAMAGVGLSSALVLAVAGPSPTFVVWSCCSAGTVMAVDSWLTRHTRRWRVKPVWPGREGRTVAVGGSHGAQEEG